MFQPIVPAPGLAGWQFLQATYDSQFRAFTTSAVLSRDVDYFRENISNVKNAEDLTSDRRLMQVALGAFGLQDDINNTFFIRKILEEGTASNSSLANRLADKRYRGLADAFGLGPGEISKTGLATFMDDVVVAYERQSFEVAVGNVSESARVALSSERRLAEIATLDTTEAGRWFEILGDPPLRQMMERAFALPSSFAQIDLDQQVDTLSDRLSQLLGSSDPAVFQDSENTQQMLQRYTALSQIESFDSTFSSNRIALELLGSV